MPYCLPLPEKLKWNFSPGFLQTIALGTMAWSKGALCKYFMSKTCSIQIECYTLIPKVSREFTLFFSSKFKLSFQASLRVAFHRTLQNIFSLKDSGMPAFNVSFLTQRFPIPSWEHLVCKHMFEQIALVLFLNFSFGSQQLYFQYSFSDANIMVLFEYF